MDRLDFVKYMKKYGYVSTKRFNGDHEIFKSKLHHKNFAVPKGKKEISKGYLWNFRKILREIEEQEKGGE